MQVAHQHRPQHAYHQPQQLHQAPQPLPQPLVQPLPQTQPQHLQQQPQHRAGVSVQAAKRPGDHTLAGSRSSKQSRGSISSAAGSNDSFSLEESHVDQGGDSSNEAHRASTEVVVEASDHGSDHGSAHESEDEGSIGSIGGLTTL